MTDWLRPEYAELKKRVKQSDWAKIRAKHLAAHPYCVECAKYGDITRGKVVDHIKPHRGNYDLFMAANNLQTLCKKCHNIIKRKEELTGGNFGCDVNGWPLGDDHYWNGGSPVAKPIDYSPVKTLYQTKGVKK